MCNRAKIAAKRVISSNDARNKKLCGFNEGKKVEGVGVNVDEGRRLVTKRLRRCLCACRVKKREMVCCDMCEGWSHLSCIGMKEGVVMEGKEFACHLCMSACFLALQREVAGVKEKLRSAKVELKKVKENRRLKDVESNSS